MVSFSPPHFFIKAHKDLIYNFKFPEWQLLFFAMFTKYKKLSLQLFKEIQMNGNKRFFSGNYSVNQVFSLFYIVKIENG